MANLITKKNISNKLEKFLKRKPTENEIQNGFKDQNILNELLMDKIEDLNIRISNLEK